MKKATTGRRTMTILAIAILALAQVAIGSEAPEEGGLTLSKASFKASYIEHDEKKARARFSVDGATVGELHEERVVEIEATDSINVQVSIVDKEGHAQAISQSFLRFVNMRNGRDNVFLLRKRGQDIKGDVDLKKEIRSDLEFWEAGTNYHLEIILGDARMHPSVTWVVTDKLRFGQRSAGAFAPKARGVFDFDVSVRKEVLPEFESPIPPVEIRAPFAKVLAANVFVLLPLLGLLLVWTRMGALCVCAQKQKGRDFGALVGLQACVVLHMVALIMFWIKWNFWTTCKVISVLMVPTLLIVRALLASSIDSSSSKSSNR